MGLDQKGRSALLLDTVNGNPDALRPRSLWDLAVLRRMLGLWVALLLVLPGNAGMARFAEFVEETGAEESESETCLRSHVAGLSTPADGAGPPLPPPVSLGGLWPAHRCGPFVPRPKQPRSRIAHRAWPRNPRERAGNVTSRGPPTL